jgi:hypothetical protein
MESGKGLDYYLGFIKTGKGAYAVHSGRRTDPIILAVEMGYGHLRPAHALAEMFGTDVIRIDAPPIAGRMETITWNAARSAYHGLSRACDLPVLGSGAKLVLENITRITPLRIHSTREPANVWTRLADGLAETFIGQSFRHIASWTGRPVIATYPVAAFAARRLRGTGIFCLVTDTDLNRAWVPVKAEESEINYLAPVVRVAERLRSFGVSERKIHITGFPLPPALVNKAESAAARRLIRLNPDGASCISVKKYIEEMIRNAGNSSPIRPISVTLAIGGAGAQTKYAFQIIKSLKQKILDRELVLSVITGVRPKVASRLSGMIRAAGLGMCINNGVRILYADDLTQYFRLFNDRLADTDVLWTKPSELVFYASLGLPILLAEPIGGQEHANRNWLLSKEAALDAGDPAAFDRRLDCLLAGGELCRIAWNGFSRLERNGAQNIVKTIGSSLSPAVFTPTTL